MIDTLILMPIKEVGGALLRRVGTACAAFLVALDVSPELVNKLLVAVGVVAGLSFDVGVALFYRHRLKIASKRLGAVEALTGKNDGGPAVTVRGSDLNRPVASVLRCPLLSCEAKMDCQQPDNCLGTARL